MATPKYPGYADRIGYRSGMTNPDEMKKPTFDDEPGDQSHPDEFTVEDATAVNAVPDEVRLHADTSESEIVQRGDGAVVDVENDD